MVTEAQDRVLRALRDLTSDGWPVTVREVGRAVGYSSPSTTFYHLLALEQEGVAVRHPRNARGGWKAVEGP